MNAAAAHQQVSMIAAELGGGGSCDPSMADFTEMEVMHCLSHLGFTAASNEIYTTEMECINLKETFVSPAIGLLDRSFHIGDKVEARNPQDGYILSMNPNDLRSNLNLIPGG